MSNAKQITATVTKLARPEFMSSKGRRENWAKWEVTNSDVPQRQIFQTKASATAFASKVRKLGFVAALNS